jgi:hypothetical protein
MGQF